MVARFEFPQIPSPAPQGEMPYGPEREEAMLLALLRTTTQFVMVHDALAAKKSCGDGSAPDLLGMSFVGVIVGTLLRRIPLPKHEGIVETIRPACAVVYSLLVSQLAPGASTMAPTAKGQECAHEFLDSVRELTTAALRDSASGTSA